MRKLHDVKSKNSNDNSYWLAADHGRS